MQVQRFMGQKVHKIPSQHWVKTFSLLVKEYLPAPDSGIGDIPLWIMPKLLRELT
jgi:hypothetical protein